MIHRPLVKNQVKKLTSHLKDCVQTQAQKETVEFTSNLEDCVFFKIQFINSNTLFI